MPRVEAFPWSELPSALSDEGRVGRARRAAERRFDLAGLGPLLRDVFAAELSGFGVTGVRIQRDMPLDPWSVRLVYPEFALFVRCQPDLVSLALTRLLERPLRVNDPRAPLSPAVAGAWHAIALEIARALSRAAPPDVALGSTRDTSGPATLLQAWVRIEARSFPLELAIVGGSLDAAEPDGDVPVTLELVSALATLLTDELASLRVGDVLLPEQTFDPERDGVVAISPNEERGFRLQLSDVVRYVGVASLPHEQEMESQPEDVTKESVIATTPVVIRVEVGTMTLSAREWMSLRPGDVLSCGVPPGGVVVLRAAGREIARGELVTVDGQLGVRIHEVSFASNDDTVPGPTPRSGGER
jgi:type III secretion system YscQ/HrcQ family protein